MPFVTFSAAPPLPLTSVTTKGPGLYACRYRGWTHQNPPTNRKNKMLACWLDKERKSIPTHTSTLFHLLHAFANHLNHLRVRFVRTFLFLLAVVGRGWSRGAFWKLKFEFYDSYLALRLGYQKVRQCYWAHHPSYSHAHTPLPFGNELLSRFVLVQSSAKRTGFS